MKKVIVRADDLGYSLGTNCGIARSVKEGIINNVGVMPNMPEAADGIRQLQGSDVCLGQHTNICFGRPLTPPEKIPSLVNAQGNFKSSKEYRNASEDFVRLEEVILEIEAQYERFKELTGQEPAYFEGHAVASRNFFRGLEIVAKRHGLRYLPFDLDGPVTVAGHQLAMKMESMDPSYRPEEFLKKICLEEEESIPVMVFHPGYLDAVILRSSSLQVPRVLEAEMAADPAIRQWLTDHDIELIRFDQL